MYCNVTIEDKNIRLFNDTDLNQVFMLGEIVVDISAGRKDYFKKIFGKQNWDYLQRKAIEMLDNVYRYRIVDQAYYNNVIKGGHDGEYSIIMDFCVEIHQEVEDHDGRLIVYDSFDGITDVVDLMKIDLFYAVRNGFKFEKCLGCNKYFLTKKRETTICEAKGGHCVQVSAKLKYSRSVKKDGGLYLYEKTYQSLYYISQKCQGKKKNGIKKIIEDMKKLRRHYKDEAISLEELSKKLNGYKEKAMTIYSE